MRLEAGCVGQVVDRVLVGGGGRTQPVGRGPFGERGQAGMQEPVMDSGSNLELNSIYITNDTNGVSVRAGARPEA